jgi:hypothetical protein
MKYKNTLKNGSVRFLIFRDGESYFGAALEFNIMVEAANPEEAFIFLNEAARGYLEAARKTKIRPNVLNQKTDPEYVKMWQDYQDRKLKEKYESIVNKLPIFSAGWLEMAKV